MKTLIWDFDGTLGYRPERWSGAVSQAIQLALPECNIGLDEIRAALQGGFPWHQPDVAHAHIKGIEQWWQMLNPVLRLALERLNVPHENIGAIVEQIRVNYVNPTAWHLFDDVSLGLKQLTALGWQHVILSNHVPELDDIVHSLGLAPHIAQLYNSAHIGYEKPNPVAFEIVLETLQTDEEVWMIGDNIDADIRGAASVGMNAILLRKSHPEAQTCCNDIWQVIDFLGSGQQ